MTDFIVVDSPMGAGKTSSIINYVKDNPNKKFIICSPYNKTVEEIALKTGLPYPVDDEQSKSRDIMQYLRNGQSVVCTHSLFFLLDDKHKELLEKHNYNLIIDEIPDNTLTVLNKNQGLQNVDSSDDINKISPKDIELLLKNKLIECEINGKLKWSDSNKDAQDYEGVFSKFKALVKLKEIYKVGSYFVAVTKFENWYCFSSVTFFTYRYKNSMLEYYFLFNGHEISNICHIEKTNGKYIIADDYKLDYPAGIERIRLYNGKYNLEYDELAGNGLSKYFFDTATNPKRKEHERYLSTLENLKGKANNYWRHIINENKQDKLVLWSTFQEYKPPFIDRKEKKLKYIKETVIDKTRKEKKQLFIPCNTRASNEYQDRTHVIYLCEINLNPNILKLLKQQAGLVIDDKMKDDFTLSCFLQFLWRSNLRDSNGTDIVNVYIPSPRLRKLFSDWLNEATEHKKCTSE